MRKNAEQLALEKQKRGDYALAAPGVAWLLDSDFRQLQKVLVPPHNRIHLVTERDPLPEGEECLAVDKMVVKDTRYKGSKRVLDQGTRFWVEVR